MRSANSYQDIKTPEDYEYDAAVEAAYKELCDEYADDIAEHGMSPANKAGLMQRAREMAKARMSEPEEETEEEAPESPHWTPETIEKEIGHLSAEKQKEWLIRKLIYFQNEYMRCHSASESNDAYILENTSLRQRLEDKDKEIQKMLNKLEAVGC